MFVLFVSPDVRLGDAKVTLWTGGSGPGGVHVLIVAVGRYQAEFEDLGGAPYSANRLADWWSRSFDRMLPNHHLASIDAVISMDGTPIVPIPEGFAEAPEANLGNVKRAFEDWAERSKDGALAVLHWLGHGETVGKDGPTQILYCSDADEQGLLNGIHWGSTVTAINQTIGHRAICFIDVCRSTSNKEPFSFEGALKLGKRVSGDDECAVFYSTRAGGLSFCHDPWETHDEARGSFHGGAIFSEAVRCALDGYAAIRRGGKTATPTVHADDILDVLRDRVELWAQMHPEEFRQVQFKPASSLAEHWLRRGLVQSPNPVSSVRFELPDPMVRAVSAKFDVTPRFGENAKLIAEHWHLDMPHGRDWKAEARCSASLSQDPRHFEETFDTTHTWQHVKLVEVAPQ